MSPDIPDLRSFSCSQARSPEPGDCGTSLIFGSSFLRRRMMFLERFEQQAILQLFGRSWGFYEHNPVTQDLSDIP